MRDIGERERGMRRVRVIYSKWRRRDWKALKKKRRRTVGEGWEGVIHCSNAKNVPRKVVLYAIKSL